MKADHYCYLLDVPVDNIGKMADFIYNKARDTLVAVDNDIIPYASASQLRSASEATISALSDFNSRIAAAIRDFSETRVLITPGIKKEMMKGCGAALSEIAKVTQRPTLDNLTESYAKLVEEGIGKRSDECPSTKGIYESLIAITRQLNLYFDLKKEELGSSESDEKLVAYAFAQGVLQDKRVCIFSNNRKHIIPLASKLYATLTANDIVGNDAKIKQRLIANPIEINCFDSTRNLYSSYDCRTANIPAPEKWVPPSKLPQEKIDELVLFIRRNLLPVEKALGNGKLLEVLVALESSEPVLPPIPEHPAEEAAEKVIAEAGAAVEKAEKPAANVPSAALERIYQRLKVNPADLDSAEQSKIEEAIKDYEALISVYSDSNASTSRLEQELEQIRSKSVVYQAAKLTKDTEALVAKRNEITKDANYFKSAEKRKEFADLTAQIDENAGKLDGLEQSLKQVQSVNALASLSDAERKLYDAFKENGFELTEEGVIINSDKLTEITQREKKSLYGLITKMEREVGLERNSDKRPAEYRIALKHLPYLVKKK